MQDGNLDKRIIVQAKYTPTISQHHVRTDTVWRIFLLEAANMPPAQVHGHRARRPGGPTPLLAAKADRP